MKKSNKEFYLFIFFIILLISLFTLSIINKDKYEEKFDKFLKNELVINDTKIMKLKGNDKVSLNNELVSISSLDETSINNLEETTYYILVDKAIKKTTEIKIEKDFVPTAVIYKFKTISASNEFFNNKNVDNKNNCINLQNYVICEYSEKFDIFDINNYIFDFKSNILIYF